MPAQLQGPEVETPEPPKAALVPPGKPTKKPKKKRSIAFRIVRGFLILLAIPIVLAGVLVGWLHTGWGQNWLRHTIEKRIGAKIDGAIEVGELHFALFGDIHLGKVKIKDADGVEAISLGALDASLSWGDLLHGKVIVKSLGVDGVHLHLIKDADGGSNLKKIFREKLYTPSDKDIHIEKIAVHDVDVDIDQPDGTKLSIQDVELAGSATINSVRKNFDVEIEPLTLGVSLEKPGGALKLGVKNLKTGATVKLAAGAGTITLHPLSASISLVRAGVEGEKAFDVSLGETTVDIGNGNLDVNLGKLVTGALELGSIKIDGALAAEGGLDGKQKADLVGLHVDAGKVNELLGKQVLGSDLDVEVHVAGPPDRIDLDAKIKTQGGTIGLKGAVGIADPTKPTYDLGLDLDGVEATKLVASTIKVPDVTVTKVSVKVKGEGKELDKIDAHADVHVTGVSANLPLKDAEGNPTGKTAAVKVDDVALDANFKEGKLDLHALDVTAFEQQVHVSGSFVVPKKHVEAKIEIEGDPGRAIELLKAAGLPLTANLKPGFVTLKRGDLVLDVKGDLDGPLEVSIHVHKLALFSGTVDLDATVRLHLLPVPTDLPPGAPKPPRIGLESIDGFEADVALTGISVDQILAMRGKSLPGLTAWLGGTVHAEGTLKDPKAKLNLALYAKRTDPDGAKAEPLTVWIGGDVEKTRAVLAVRGKRALNDLLSVDAYVPLALEHDPRGPDWEAPFSVKARIPETLFTDLIALAPPKLLEGKLERVQPLLPGATIALDVDLKGSLMRPKGEFGLAVDLPAKKYRAKVGGTIERDDSTGATVVAANTRVWLDTDKPALATLDAHAKFSASPLVPVSITGYRALQWDAKLDVPDTALAGLPLSPKAQLMGGTVGLTADLKGNTTDVLGSLRIRARDVKPTQSGPVDATVAVDITDEKVAVDVGVDLSAPPVEGQPGTPKSPLLFLKGTVGLAGKNLIPTVKTLSALPASSPALPALDLTLDIPNRPVASLGSLRPNLAKIPGNLSGNVAVTGNVKEPLAKGEILVDGFTTVSNDAGRIAVNVDANHEDLRASIGIGTGTVPPVQIEAHAKRSEIPAISNGSGRFVVATAKADKVDLRTLLPNFALDKVKGLGVKGELNWDMQFGATIAKVDGKTTLVAPALTGELSIKKGEVDLPNTKRTYEDVTVELRAGKDGLKIDKIAAIENDLEVKHRWIDISGDLFWSDPLHVESAALDIRAEKWLLFGAKTIGMADAPRGTLSIDAKATSTLDKPIKVVGVDIKKLEVLFPDRYERSHQQEDSHLGDLMVLGDTGSDGKAIELGKLPVAPAVLEKIKKEEEARVAQAEVPVAGTPEGAPPVAPAPASGADITITVEPGARLFQAPIDVSPQGTISLELRPGSRKIRGKLTMNGGSLQLGGAIHPLLEGALTFDDANPQGFMDVSFGKKAKNSALRDIAVESEGDQVLIHMFGPISDRRTVLSGAGSPGALYDLLSMHNQGRQRYVTEPDMPMSNTVQYPTHDGLLVLSFISVNLPHLLFLDKVKSWSDPYDGYGAYGQIDNYEAQRVTENGKVRVVATRRPESAGQSDHELELDYLFTNNEQTLFGVGAVAGSRGGGGADIFVEWSSKD
ncbi:MAG: AsmA family protein [Polyangiaceae bacterium]